VVVILCGGKGTRSYPFTEYFPKVMMPINGMPILVHLMHIYASQGFTSFVLATGYRKEMIYDYFDGRFQKWNIEIVDTGAESDTGERIAKCRPYVDGTFFATYGDGLGDLDFEALLASHRRASTLATLTTVPLRSQYGMVVFDKAGKVERFQEKPVISDYWINAGFFALEARAFDHWHGRNLEQEVLPALAARGELSVFQHRGFWKSMDTSKDQQEMEQLYIDGVAPWSPPGKIVGFPPKAQAAGGRRA